MEVFGLLLILGGAFLVDAGITNRNPVQVFTDILKNPGNARASFGASKGSGYATIPNPPPSSNGSASGASPALYSPTGSASGASGAAIAYARAQIGKPYQWGATGPDSFDCSGLIVAAFKAGTGYGLPRTTYTMIADPRLTVVSKANLQPGDLVFPDAGHVGIYTGNGSMIDAPHTGAFVREGPVWGFLTARRIPLPGNANPILSA